MNARNFSLAIIFAVLFVANALWGMGVNLTPSAQNDRDLDKNRSVITALPKKCIVKVVFDGDTLGCDFDGDGKAIGKAERVRLLGIDTPESEHSSKNKTGKDMPCAQTARQTLLSWVSGKTLSLKYDLNPVDKYHRKLAFAYLPGDKMPLNQKLIELGYAKTLFIGANRLYEAQFVKAEDEARDLKRGIWSPNACAN